MFRFGEPGGRIYGALGTANANLLAWWTSLVTAGTLSLPADGRVTGSSLTMTFNSNQACQLVKTLDAQQTWGMAFAFKTSTLPTGTNTLQLAAFLDAGSQQADIRLNSSGQVILTRNGNVLGTSTAVVSVNAWTHAEFKVKIDPSAGTAYLAVNGVQQFSLTGQVTRATANSTANQAQIGCSFAPTGVVTSPVLKYDDVIVYDGQATDANGLTDITGPVGDCGLLWELPTGAGTTTNLTPTGAATDWQAVNNATPDGDTSYAASATPGDLDTYQIADLPGTASGVLSVAVVLYARKDDVGARGVKTELRSAGGNSAHATEISLSNSYLYYFQNWGQDPHNGSPAAWSVAAVNALEAGLKVSS